jgi:hypothetical protein
MSKTLKTLPEIPSELITMVFSNLNIKDAINLGRVNKQMREIYLYLVTQTKYILPNYNYRQPKKEEIVTYIHNILQNIRMGNRTVVLKIHPGEDNSQTHESPIFKIINVTPPAYYSDGIKLYLMNNTNTRIIYFNILDNNIISDKEQANNDLVMKFIIDTPFNAKIRPLNYTFVNNKIKRQ